MSQELTPDDAQLIIAKANHLAFQLSRAFEEYAVLRMEYDRVVQENENLKNALPKES